MRRWIHGLFVAALCTGVLAAAETPVTPDLGSLEKTAATSFSPAAFTREGSDLNVACDHVLLCFQALSVTIIVAGLVGRLRDEKTQMEGVAMTLLKVAFIALIPGLREMFVGAADLIASSIGYQSVTANGASSPVMSDLWTLVGEWVPPGSPYLDALSAQSAENIPAPGAEQTWGLAAWNWARGVGTADASLFHGLWQAASGSLRALVVFGSCSLMVCCLSFTIMLTYLSEILRYLLFYGGCALLPIFIAGLSVEALRPASVKYILGTMTIAVWPIGWALANIVTHFVAQQTHEWMVSVTTSAMTRVGQPPSSLAIAAPYLAWGILFLFVGVTVALCLWMLTSVFYVPLLMGRAMTAGGAHFRGAMDAVPMPVSTASRGALAGPPISPPRSPGKPTTAAPRVASTARSVTALSSTSRGSSMGTFTVRESGAGRPGPEPAPARWRRQAPGR